MENPAGKSLQRGWAVPGLEADFTFFYLFVHAAKISVQMEG
jgi:hypothetical protein